MFTGLVLFCTVELECFTQSSVEIFTTLEACLASTEYHFYTQLEDPRILVGDYTCVDWGVSA